VNYELIKNEAELVALCRRLGTAERIGLDTEFVSEDTYWPQLCLMQVATADQFALVDTLAVGDVGPLWRQLAEGSHQTICHAAREESLFSLNAVERPPANLFDIQIAAGMVGFEYPAGYGSLINKLLDERPPKGETRTDWRKRPLSRRQLDYAVADVRYLIPAAERLEEMVAELDRRQWVEAEQRAWQQEIDAARTRPRWRKVSGVSGLSSRSLAIVRELWFWREEEARRLDRPARRVLRDDLIVEIAKRASGDPKRISSIRGIERSGVKRKIAQLAACVDQALKSPETKRPATGRRRDQPPQLNLLGQVLTATLTSICRRAQIAPSIVGTASDVREFVSFRLGFGDREDSVPRLAEGWRAELVGHALDDVLSGRTSMRIANPLSDEPLAFEATEMGSEEGGES